MTRNWLLSICVCLAVLCSRPALAVDWLVFLVDRSNSIDDRELALQRQADIKLLSDRTVIQAQRAVQVAVVEFDTQAQVVVSWTDAKSAARRYSRRSARR